MSKDDGSCGNLRYTQRKSGKTIIREPEATFVLARILNERNIDFDVEVPTKRRYVISGEKPDTASIDLSVFTDGGQINIEFKTSQPSVKEIEKDIIKILGEDIYGSAFFHNLKNFNRGTLKTILDKYEKAYQHAIQANDISSKWFVRFIFVKEKKQCYWRIFDNILKITDFDIENFHK